MQRMGLSRIIIILSGNKLLKATIVYTDDRKTFAKVSHCMNLERRRT